jgi:hypothetical protein
MQKYCLPIVINPTPRDYDLNKLAYGQCFYVDLTFPEKIFKDFPYIIIICKYCSPTLTTGAVSVTNLILHYVRKLTHKFQIFSLGGS